MAEITLATLARGAVAELFDEELRKIGENILDINTDAKAVRKLRIELEFRPEDDDRREVPVRAKVVSSLAPYKVARTRLYFGRRDKALSIAEDDARQADLFQPAAEPAPTQET